MIYIVKTSVGLLISDAGLLAIQKLGAVVFRQHHFVYSPVKASNLHTFSQTTLIWQLIARGPQSQV